MKSVMTVAWRLAKKGAKKFGGSSVDYLSESLKIAWKLVGKDNVKPASKTKKTRLTIAAGSRNHKSWVAAITGSHVKYKFERSFVDSVDHNMSERHFDLKDGLYDVCDAGTRYFVRVKGGKIERIDEQDVKAAVA